jgi:hypothetical protein
VPSPGSGADAEPGGRLALAQVGQDQQGLPARVQLAPRRADPLAVTDDPGGVIQGLSVPVTPYTTSVAVNGPGDGPPSPSGAGARRHQGRAAKYCRRMRASRFGRRPDVPGSAVAAIHITGLCAW